MRLSQRSAFLVHWVVVTLVVAVEAFLVPRLQVDSVALALAGAVLVGLLNAAVRPVLIREAELHGVMLGIVYIVLNVFLFGIAADFFVDVDFVGPGVGVAALLIPGVVSTLVAMLVVPEE